MANTSSNKQKLQLDQKRLDAAKQSLDQGAVTPDFGPYREDIIRLLNDALATEMVCVLRYKRHHFTATGLESPAIAGEFLQHAVEEQQHADMICKRIVQLGGEPDLNPDTLTRRSHADYNEQLELHEMIRANLVAERVAIEAYTQIIELVGDKDPTTRRMIEQILEMEQDHADELSDWMNKAS
ncbi:ferritin-like domain-containing protein [Diaphorobacter ruginosibacter]|uniref:Ferritin-like domain-containing protein n=1 Tax=Diaphorobacter ruginosibacter TaxID=1715720 RepID=A0A7G9RNB3_9BURK|nr:ferritin-like domain-containing protein [Diaphorobacter ruginosibacter]QNN57088.1 ferritin-like domain-containing protein [Diaphorobacter ruginosibacter]